VQSRSRSLIHGVHHGYDPRSDGPGQLRPSRHHALKTGIILHRTADRQADTIGAVVITRYHIGTCTLGFQAHNLKVEGSNPSPATNFIYCISLCRTYPHHVISAACAIRDGYHCASGHRACVASGRVLDETDDTVHCKDAAGPVIAYPLLRSCNARLGIEGVPERTAHDAGHDKRNGHGDVALRQVTSVGPYCAGAGRSAGRANMMGTAASLPSGMEMDIAVVSPEARTVGLDLPGSVTVTGTGRPLVIS
jgi:hypothetical protein